MTFGVGERNGSGRVRCRTVEHRHPEDAPTQDTEDGDQIDQAVGGAELGFLSFAAGFQDLVKRFNFPACGIPLEFFDSLKGCGDRQIRNQFPIDPITAGWNVLFLSVNDGQAKFWISFCLPIGGRTRMRRYRSSNIASAGWPFCLIR